MCPFHYTAVAVSGKVGYPLTGLTTSVWWLSLQLTVLSRSATLCNWSSWWRFCVVKLLFGFCCECRGFYHTTESDIFLYLWKLKHSSTLFAFISCLTILKYTKTAWFEFPFYLQLILILLDFKKNGMFGRHRYTLQFWFQFFFYFYKKLDMS